MNSIVFIAESTLRIQLLSRKLQDSGSRVVHKEPLTARALLSTVKLRLNEVSKKATRQPAEPPAKAVFSQSPELTSALSIKREVAELECSIVLRKESEVERLTTGSTVHHSDRLAEAICAVIGVGAFERYFPQIKRLQLNLETRLASIKTFTFHSKLKLRQGL